MLPKESSRGLYLAALLAAFLAFAIPRARAWGPGGHLVVAGIAYQTMSPEARQRAAAILQAHPAMPQWQNEAAKDNPPDLAAYVFMKASNWPDEIRRKNSSPYDHPAWHYIDYPLTPPDFPFAAGLAPQDNILFGIESSRKTLADPAAAPEQRAAALSWLIHLVGDLHQPLHCAEWVQPPAYPLPEGDRGGNLFFVSVGGTSINLHAFWDRLPGQIFSPAYAATSVERIQKVFPPSSLPEIVKDTDPTAWSLEGRTLAIEKAYLRGKLPGASTPNIPPPLLPTDYLENSRQVSDRCLALAGYRLGTMVVAAVGAPELMSAPGKP